VVAVLGQPALGGCCRSSLTRKGNGGLRCHHGERLSWHLTTVCDLLSKVLQGGRAGRRGPGRRNPNYTAVSSRSDRVPSQSDDDGSTTSNRRRGCGFDAASAAGDRGSATGRAAATCSVPWPSIRRRASIWRGSPGSRCGGTSSRAKASSVAGRPRLRRASAAADDGEERHATVPARSRLRRRAAGEVSTPRGPEGATGPRPRTPAGEGR
jgi:hypothetical protein